MKKPSPAPTAPLLRDEGKKKVLRVRARVQAGAKNAWPSSIVAQP